MTSRESLERILQMFIADLNTHTATFSADKQMIDEAINPMLVKFRLDHLKSNLFKPRSVSASSAQTQTQAAPTVAFANTPDLWQKKTTPVIKHVPHADSVVETIKSEDIPVEKELFEVYQNKLEGNKEKFASTKDLIEFMTLKNLDAKKWNNESKLEKVYADFERQVEKLLGL